jgi:hypothetical protein
MLKFNKNVLINELYKGKNSMEKISIKSMHCCYLITKTILGLKKIQRKWTQNGFSNLQILATFWSTLPCIYFIAHGQTST